MSFSFYVDAPEPPDYQAVLFGLNLDDVLRIETDGSTEGPWPNATFHFHRRGLSTRAVEVAWDGEEFQVRILTLASPEDYDLGLRFIQSASAILGGDIQPEDDEPLSLEDLRAKYDAKWIREMNVNGADVIRAMILKGNYSKMTMMGPIRPFHIGPRLIEELEELGPADEFVDRLIECMYRVQNVDMDEYFGAAAMELSTQENPDKKITAAVWGPDVKYLFPDVEYLIPFNEKREPFFIPYEAITDLLDDGWEWLDECQMLVDAVPVDDWPDFLDRARTYAENPLES